MKKLLTLISVLLLGCTPAEDKTLGELTENDVDRLIEEVREDLKKEEEALWVEGEILVAPIGESKLFDSKIKLDQIVLEQIKFVGDDIRIIMVSKDGCSVTFIVNKNETSKVIDYIENENARK